MTMGLTDLGVGKQRTETASRLDLAWQILRHRYDSLIAPLGERFDIRTYRVARTIRGAEFDRTDRSAASDLSPQDANGTALGTLLNRVIDDAAANELAGVLLFSDGRSTCGPNPLSVLRERTGSEDRAAILPVWAVPPSFWSD